MQAAMRHPWQARLAIVGLALCTLAACQQQPARNGTGASPATSGNTGGVPAGTPAPTPRVGNTTTVTTTVKPPAAAAPPPAAPEPPEKAVPPPKGDNWVYTPRLKHYIGEQLEVRYKLGPAVKPGVAWIGLAPADITATDMASNKAKDVTSAKTVPAAEASINLKLGKPGKFRLRLFSSQDKTGKLLGQSGVLTVTQWPLGDRKKSKPPYVTIGPVGNKGKIEVQRGFPVIAYYEVPQGYPPTAWLGLVPMKVVSPLAKDNLPARVVYTKLAGMTKSQFTWMADKPGTYAFRLFPSDAPGTDYVATSETFTIVGKK